MADFDQALQTLVQPLDAATHAAERDRLERCRGPGDLERLVASGGWLSPAGTDPRLKLIKHGAGTYLVVAYDPDGWSTRLSMADVHSRRW